MLPGGRVMTLRFWVMKSRRVWFIFTIPFCIDVEKFVFVFLPLFSVIESLGMIWEKGDAGRLAGFVLTEILYEEDLLFAVYASRCITCG